jgi:hypothetical protein
MMSVFVCKARICIFSVYDRGARKSQDKCWEVQG